MSKIKISILVPVYNAERYIERCVCSLFEQTYTNIEFVFVNDNTHDKSIDILKNILERYPVRKSQTKIINHSENLGVAVARNTLLDNATGDYVLWVDADDFIKKNTVEILVSKVETTRADIVCFNTAWYTELKGAKIMPENKALTPYDFIQDVLNCKISPVLWGRLFKLSLFRKYDIKFIKGLNMGEDMLVLLKVVYYSEILVNEKSVLYYQEVGNSDSLSRSYSPESIDTTLKVLDRIDQFFADKFDISSGLKIRKLELFIRKLHQICISNDKKSFISLKKQALALKYEGVKLRKRSLYDVYLFCDNYVLCRIYSLFLKLVRHLKDKFKIRY